MTNMSDTENRFYLLIPLFFFSHLIGYGYGKRLSCAVMSDGLTCKFHRQKSLMFVRLSHVLLLQAKVYDRREKNLCSGSKEARKKSREHYMQGKSKGFWWQCVATTSSWLLVKKAHNVSENGTWVQWWTAGLGTHQSRYPSLLPSTDEGNRSSFRKVVRFFNK
jgi:hypothetical protein